MARQYNITRGEFPCERCKRVFALKTNLISHAKYCGQRVLRAGEYYDEHGKIRRHKPGTYAETPKYSKATVSRAAAKAFHEGKSERDVKDILEACWEARGVGIDAETDEQAELLARLAGVSIRIPDACMARLQGEGLGQWRARLKSRMERALAGDHGAWTIHEGVLPTPQERLNSSLRRQRRFERTERYYDKRRRRADERLTTLGDIDECKRRVKHAWRRMRYWLEGQRDYVKHEVRRRAAERKRELREENRRKLYEKMKGRVPWKNLDGLPPVDRLQ